MEQQQKKYLVALQFSDLHSLWLFAQSITTTYLEINRIKNTLSCECTEGELQTAQQQYNATMVNAAVESN